MNRLTVQQIDQHIQDSDASHDWDDEYVSPRSDETLEYCCVDDTWLDYEESRYYDEGEW